MVLCTYFECISRASALPGLDHSTTTSKLKILMGQRLGTDETKPTLSSHSRIQFYQREFTRLLFPILIRKLKRSMPTLLPHPPLLAHTIYQALAFDEALKEAGFDLSGTYEKPKEVTEWQGTSNIILGNPIWFDAWVEGERKCK